MKIILPLMILLKLPFASPFSNDRKEAKSLRKKSSGTTCFLAK
jgi:hypothetical protein